ncbi:hypothetical protein [Paenibacillus sp. AGC30]
MGKTFIFEPVLLKKFNEQRTLKTYRQPDEVNDRMICGDCGQEVRLGISDHCPPCGEILPDLRELDDQEDK